jgi:hypothetical protein
MGTLTLIFVVGVIAGCTGCTTVRQFYGMAANLKGDGGRTPGGTHLKISVTCSGTAADGDRYVAFSFRGQKCWLVVIHPPVGSRASLRTQTATGQTSAWLVRGIQPVCSVLARSGASAALLGDRAERLHGSVEIVRLSNHDFYMPVELAGEAGETAVRGEFRSYKALWRPLVGPAMLLGVGGAAHAPKVK